MTHILFSVYENTYYTKLQGFKYHVHILGLQVNNFQRIIVKPILSLCVAVWVKSSPDILQKLIKNSIYGQMSEWQMGCEKEID